MSESFDPYYVWLAIPSKDQPPNHYRLLAVELFEDNPAVIEGAADQRMAHLRTYQLGKHAAASQKLLNEVGAAKVCLLNPAKKAAYDQRLRERLQTSAVPLSDSRTADLDSSRTGLIGSLDPNQPPSRAGRTVNRPRLSPAVLYGGAVVAVIALASVAVWWGLQQKNASRDARLNQGERPSAGEQAKSGPPTLPQPTTAPAPGVAVAPLEREPRLPSPQVTPAPAEFKPQSKEAMPVLPKKELPAMVTPSPDVVPAEKPGPKSEATPPPKKIAPPSADEQQRLIATVDGVYRPGDVQDQAAKVALIRRLLDEGLKSAPNRPEQFVIFRRAGEIARDAGEVALILEAVDAMSAAGFDIQPVPLKARLLTQLAKQRSWSSALELPTICAACSAFAEGAVAEGAVEEACAVLDAIHKASAEAKKQAQQALRIARTAAARARNPADKAAREQRARDAEAELETILSALGAMAECSKRVQQAQQEHEEVQSARDRLQARPDDPNACLSVGRWTCFYEGDWEAGFKLLAKGSDRDLKSLATKELAVQPSNAEDHVAAGDLWWDLAEKATGRDQAAMRLRAGYWYQQSLPTLVPGLTRSKVEQRLAQTAPAPTTKASAVTVTYALKPIRGQWTTDGSRFTNSPEPWAELVVELTRWPAACRGFEVTCSVSLSSAEWGSRLKVETTDGMSAEFPFAGQRHGHKPMEDFLAGRTPGPPCFLTPNAKYAFRCHVSDGRLSAWINDKLYCSAPLTREKERKAGTQSAPLIRFNCSWSAALIRDFRVKGL